MWDILEKINSFVWSIPALFLILGVGLYLAFRTGFAQLRYFPRAMRHFATIILGNKRNNSGTSSFRALCTALAATVGTGNLVGVAGAIALGGPGSIFWMWISALLGMVTKFAEAVLSVRYRIKGKNGEFLSGPMYMIRQGMGDRWAWLGGVYSCFGVLAAFGVGNATQVNAVVGGINSAITAFGGTPNKMCNFIIGIVLTVLIGTVLLGGAKRIGLIAEKLVPFASAVYMILAIYVLAVCYDAIPGAFRAIVVGAFSPKAVTGGVIGSITQALSVGIRRGVFTNEAGMGTAAMAHGGADVFHPVEQGFMGIVEVFLDTIVICTLSALVILCSGVQINYGTDIGANLTANAFATVCGSWVNILLAAILACFAVATILGWGLYGMRCAQYLFGEKCWKSFAWLQTATILVGAILNTATVWVLAEIVNGLMAIPNLIALLYLSPELCRLLREYDHNMTKSKRC